MASFLSLLKNPAWDIMLIFMLVAVGFFWGMTAGKRKLGLGILAIYSSLVIFPQISISKFVEGRSLIESWVMSAGIFLVIFVFILLFLLRAFNAATAKESELWWEILILSFLGTGFLIASLLRFAPDEIIKNNLLGLSPLALKIFTDPQFLKWWTILPILGILFL